jgi:EmrB/QacA subfamily drug resistance transporter
MDVKISEHAEGARASEVFAPDGAGSAAAFAHAGPDAPVTDLAQLTHRERRIIVMAMMLPVFLGSIDQSILASAMPTIGRTFGDVHDLPWLITSYLIAGTALTPLYGKFADIHGRRATLLIALGVYMVGSLVSALSTSMLMLICGRVVQGCGGGGLTTSATMVLGDIAAPKDRAKYYAYFSAAFTSAGACGPVVGGWICDHWHWSLIFLWKFPFCILAGTLSLIVLRRLPRYERPHRLDFIGAILIMSASSSFMLALTLGGVRYPWLSIPVLALFGCSLVLGVGFIVRLLSTVEPLIPIAILSDRTARLAMVANSFGWGSLIGLNIFLPMYLQSVLGWSATDSGLSLMILMVTLNASAGLSSQLIGRVKHYKLLPCVCLIIAIGAVIALALSTSHMSTPELEVVLFLIGVGFGPMSPLTQVALQNTVANYNLGSAIGAMNFMRTLCGTILVAMFGAIVLAAVPIDTAATIGEHILTEISASDFTVVFLTAAGTLSIAFMALILLEEKPLLGTLPAVANKADAGKLALQGRSQTT